MADHKSAKKRIVRNEKKRIQNKSRMSKIKTFIKNVLKLISDKAEITKIDNALSTANSQLAKGVKKGIISKQKMARTMSKLAKKSSSNSK